MKRYLDLVSLKEARAILESAFPAQMFSGTVSVGDSVDRITASPLFARFSIPERHLSAMDGIAVRSRDTVDASEQRPVTLESAVRVNTGNIVPDPCDSVIMIEDVWVDGDRFTIRKPVSPWQHVRPVGEDLGETEMILPSLHRIRAHETGALAAYGVTEVEVLSLRAGLIPTGSELVEAGVRPPPGKVVESNTVMAAALLAERGVKMHRYPITPDDPGLIREAVERGVSENDLLLISAGSSAGTRDFTADVIAELGEVLVHGIAIKPGKPCIIGRIDGKPVIGLPGYPLAALTVLREIVEPLLGRYGMPETSRETVDARITTTLASDIGTDEFVLLSVGKIGRQWVGVPQSRGAGVQMNAVRANAYTAIPAPKEGIAAGEITSAVLSVPRHRAEAALLLTGSHDPALDYLANFAAFRGVDLHSTHVGSMGGLLSLKRRDCHGAPMHLLGPDGDYNIPFLKRYIPDADLILISIADRQQGIVSRDGIGFDELAGHRFINRQKGSGTRMLLDHLMREQGLDPSDLPGYERELTTHLGVALAVRTGDADAGMCTYSAAKILDLPFRPVATERYELVLYRDTLDDGRAGALLDTIRSPEFKNTLTRLGGYDITGTGTRRELP